MNNTQSIIVYTNPMVDTMDNYITYAHPDDPNVRFRQLACDAIPVWAKDVRDGYHGFPQEAEAEAQQTEGEQE